MIISAHRGSQSWIDLPWKKFQRHLFGLQMRVFKAKSLGDERKARKLQKLIIRSKSAQFLAIKKVTELNQGNKNSNIDGNGNLRDKDRFNLVDRLMLEHHNWKHQSLRNVSISMKDGSVKMLKIPTIADRAWQCLAKEAIEPYHEATFHDRNYGFRPARNLYDVQRYIFLNLSNKAKGYDKKIMQIDVEKCLERIPCSLILKNISAPKCIKLGLFRCLKAGMKAKFPNESIMEVLTISPLLANIVLNGIEEIHPCVRYADDIVYFLEKTDDPEKILEKINKFLANKGFIINKQKTQITSTKSGFDFCGWHFKYQKNRKLKVYPSLDSYKKFKTNVKKTINKTYWSIEDRVRKLAFIVQGWRNYHKYCDMSSLKFSLFGMERRACRVFNTKKRNKLQAIKLMKKAFPSVSYGESQFIFLKGNHFSDNGYLDSCSRRNSKSYGNMTLRALRKQY